MKTKLGNGKFTLTSIGFKGEFTIKTHGPDNFLTANTYHTCDMLYYFSVSSIL